MASSNRDPPGLTLNSDDDSDDQNSVHSHPPDVNIEKKKYPEKPPTLKCRNVNRCGAKNHNFIIGVGCFNSGRWEKYRETKVTIKHLKIHQQQPSQ